MAEYTGKDADYRWIWSGGTVNFSADHRTFNYSPSIDLHESTAGSDVAKTYVTGVKDGSMTLTLVHQGGTALDGPCAEGVGGTLFWSPEGTGYTTVICRREDDYESVETSPTGVKTFTAGGLYRIRVTK